MKVTAVGKYDVYTTTGDAKTQFVTALNGVTGNSLAIVTSRDAITIDTNMQAALRDFGADAPLMTQARMSFVFVGKKGIGAGNGVMKTSAVSAASVTVRIIEGVCMDFFSGGGLAEWKEETTSGIQNLKEQVTLYAQKVTTVEGTVTTMRSELDVLPGEISSKVEKNDYNGETLVSMINQTAESVTIDASKINLVGKVTIGMFDKTILENGKIKTELINADALVAKNLAATKGTIGGFTIESGRLAWKQYGYFGEDSRSLYLGASPENTDGVVDIKFGAATTGKFGLKCVGSNMGGASVYASTGNLLYPASGMTYAGFLWVRWMSGTRIAEYQVIYALPKNSDI